MIITALVENSTLSKDYKNKHGLCLHIKTKSHNILFDLGPDDTFIKNAKKLNINIEDVDIVVISHGHKDHGGGLEAFLNHNSKAKIYINENAFGLYYTSLLKYGKYYVGLNTELKDNSRVILTNETFNIDSDIFLVSKVQGKMLTSSSNESLFRKEGTKYVQDTFDHEQNLIIKENDNYILISGCSHCGITNIIDRVEKVIGKEIYTAIGGFHLFNPVTNKSESEEFINSLGEYIYNSNIKFYTCHCTGVKPFEILHKKLGDQIDYLATGKVIEI